VLVLLCAEANSPSLTGLYDRHAPDGWLTNRYNYHVVRLWKEDPEQFLSAGAALVPLMEGVANMQESTTYQAILREGRNEGLIEGRNEGLIEGRLSGERQLLVRLGTKRFGPPDTATVAAIEAIRDVNRLESLGERILEPDLESWDELLRTP